MDLAAVLAHYRATGILLPVSGGSGESGPTGPSGPANPDNPAPTGPTGVSFTPVTTQEEFDRRVQGRLIREADKVRTELSSAIRAEIQADLDAKAERDRLVTQGQFQKIAEDFEKVTIPALQAKVADLETKLTAAESRLTDFDKRDEDAFKEDLKKLSEKMQRLMPEGMDLAKKREWLKNALEAAGPESPTGPTGPRRPRDPAPLDVNATAPELVRTDLQRSGLYRPPL